MQIDDVDVARLGALFIVSGPSGAGKTSVSRPAIDTLGGIEMSVSVTTRPPRAGEQQGVDYLFVTPEKFDLMVDEGAFAEWAVVHGAKYGTTRASIERAGAAGVDLLLDIDVQGAAQLRKSFTQAVSIFLLPPSRAKLEARLSGRGTDPADVVKRRIERAVAEIAEIRDYDYVIVNDNLEHATAAFTGIVSSERRRVRLLRPQGLTRAIGGFEGPSR